MDSRELASRLYEAKAKGDKFEAVRLAGIAADKIEALERLVQEMASLLRVADFEDISDYHAFQHYLKQCENI